MTIRTSQQFQYEIGASIRRGDLVAAAASATALRAAWPSDGAGWFLGSIVALLADQKEVALALVNERLAGSPDDLQCQLQKAECLLALGNRSAAIDAAEQAAAGAAQDPAALDAVGEFFVHAAAHTNALDIYDKAVALAHRDITILAKRAVVHRFLGNFGLAAHDYAAVLKISPANAEALKGITELGSLTADAPTTAQMESALASVSAEGKDAATLHFGLAKSYEDSGDYRSSWRHLKAGNDIERARLEYDSATDTAVFDRIIAGFPHLEVAAQDTTGERPIFIVGLPRTGTTLVERILGNHSEIHAAGELPALSEAVAVAVSHISTSALQDWPSFAAAIARADGAVIAQEYVARSRARRGNRLRFLDKQPTNFFYCASIFRSFPNARIIHLTRHPLAACYAIYKTRFGGTYPFSYNLNEVGAFYSGYRRLMAHWHRILPGRILDVPYEDVVTALESTTRKMMNYLDLQFEAACLDFHLNPASTATASAVQVRQPLYASSLHQWRHYAAELAPLRAQLIESGIAVDDGEVSELA